MVTFFILTMILFEGVLIVVIVKKIIESPAASWDPNSWKLMLIVTTQVLTSGTVAALGGMGAIDFSNENASAKAAGAGVVWCVILFILGYTPWVKFTPSPTQGPKHLPVDNKEVFLFDAWLERNEHLRALFTGTNEEYCTKDLFISVFFKSRNKNKLETPSLTTVFLYKKLPNDNDGKICLVKFQLLTGGRSGAATHLFQVASPTIPSQTPIQSVMLWRAPGGDIQILSPPEDGEIWHLVDSGRVQAFLIAYYPPGSMPLSADYMWVETTKYAQDYAEDIKIVIVSDRELVMRDERRPTLWEAGPAFEHPDAPADETIPAYLRRLTTAKAMQKCPLPEIKEWLDQLLALKGHGKSTALRGVLDSIRKATGSEFGGLLLANGTTEGDAAVMQTSRVSSPLLVTYAWQSSSPEGGGK